jgi:hypothetical protein
LVRGNWAVIERIDRSSLPEWRTLLATDPGCPHAAPVASLPLAWPASLTPPVGHAKGLTRFNQRSGKMTRIAALSTLYIAALALLVAAYSFALV